MDKESTGMKELPSFNGPQQQYINQCVGGGIYMLGVDYLVEYREKGQ